MILSVEIIKKRKNTTAPWEVRAIQSVIKQNFMDSPSRLTRQPYLAAEVIPSYQFALKSISKLLASYGQTGGETPKAFHTVAAGLFLYNRHRRLYKKSSKGKLLG